MFKDMMHKNGIEKCGRICGVKQLPTENVMPICSSPFGSHFAWFNTVGLPSNLLHQVEICPAATANIQYPAALYVRNRNRNHPTQEQSP